MKKIIKKMKQAVQLVLMSPLKLPTKAMNIVKYIGLSLGIIETVFEDKEQPEKVKDRDDETSNK